MALKKKPVTWNEGHDAGRDADPGLCDSGLIQETYKGIWILPQ